MSRRSEGVEQRQGEEGQKDRATVLGLACACDVLCHDCVPMRWAEEAGPDRR